MGLYDYLVENPPLSATDYCKKALVVARSITLPDGKLMLQNLGGNNMLPWPGKEKKPDHL